MNPATGYVEVGDILLSKDRPTVVIKRTHANGIVDVNFDGTFKRGYHASLKWWQAMSYELHKPVKTLEGEGGRIFTQAADGLVYDIMGNVVKLSPDGIPQYVTHRYHDQSDEFRFECGDLVEGSEATSGGYGNSPFLIIKQSWGTASWGKRARSYGVLSADGRYHEWLLEHCFEKYDYGET